MREVGENESDKGERTMNTMLCVEEKEKKAKGVRNSKE